MRVLFDQGTPVPLRNHLAPPHEVVTAYEMGWGNLANGELLQQAELQGFDVLVTTDQNLKYQQNLAGRRVAIVVLTATSWPRIQKILLSVVEAVCEIQANGYIEVQVPYGR
ncbi:MAG: DUF5615 family PIN-like protein [Panacagrimonas sp.]